MIHILRTQQLPGSRVAAIRREALGRGERAAQREEAALGGHRDPAGLSWPFW